MRIPARAPGARPPARARSSAAGAVLLGLALSLPGASCAGAGSAADPPRGNPPAEGFDLAGSDPRAVAIADQVMEALGGRDDWERVRALAWTFFGRRRHVWDKGHDNLRFEEGERVVLMNLRTGEGRAWDGGDEITAPPLLAQALQGARRAWINDSYWLLMPYKLKDTGVTLRHGGEGALPDGRAADILVLTFDQVGVTPQNRYHVWVSRDRRLVEQWAYFEERGDAEPRMVTPWADWRPYGAPGHEILLASDRGEGRTLEDIEVFYEPPEALVTPPE